MKKYARLIFLLIIILLIWNAILTVFVFNNKNSVQENTDIVETKVTGFSTDLTEVIDNCKSSIVTIETNNSISSGLIYKTNSNSVYILTTYHGVQDKTCKVTFASGATYEANVVNKDIFADVCVIEVETNVEVLPTKLGNSNLVKEGEFVVIIGTPKSIQYALSNEIGVVSSSLRSINNSVNFENTNYEYINNVIQLSGNINAGYSGAPVLNMAGEVVGMITMKDDTAVFATPINELKIIADNIINGNEYTKIQFGIKGKFVNLLESYEKNQLNIPLDVNNGYYINSVMNSSLAANAGIKEGDVIISINGLEINDYDDLLSIEYDNTDTFNITVVRNNETINLVGKIND